MDDRTMKYTPDVMASGKRKPVRKKAGVLMKFRARSRKSLILASLWLIITSVCTILAFTIGGALWVAASLLSGIATAMIAIATFDPNSIETTSRTSTTKGHSAGGKGNSKNKKTNPSQRKKVCSSRCRNSTKPLTDCRCSCGGKTHGIKHRDA
jgi:hypothetical protein